MMAYLDAVLMQGHEGQPQAEPGSTRRPSGEKASSKPIPGQWPSHHRNTRCGRAATRSQVDAGLTSVTRGSRQISASRRVSWVHGHVDQVI
jgi:hypothetical protein